VTLCYPLSYDPHAAPSKEDDGALERGANAHLALTQDDAVTLDQ
jgi:hypothetical protein